MITYFRSLIILFVTAAVFNSYASAHNPVLFLEVLKVTPSRVIDHAVDLKSKFDGDKVQTKLSGPRFFSRAVGCWNMRVKKPLAYLNWFAIVEPTDEPVRNIEVLDMIRGSSSKQLRIKAAEYFLTPSQLINSGPPDEIPSGLDRYKAYRVVEAPALDLEATLTDSIGPEKRRLLKPIFVCLPVREWHHEEYFDASHPDDCFVVYELNPLAHAENFSTLDQFGLNQLKTTDHQWLCVHAALLGPSPQ